jgi:CBS domain-containing protein
METRDVMTRHVVTVEPDTAVKHAAELMAERGFAALPVVEAHRLVGIVTESDVLRDRVAPDPRLHLRRSEPWGNPAPPKLVRGVMTSPPRSVEASADVADVARMFVDEHLRSVPVMEHDALIGIVSRRDVLTVLGRPDDRIRADVLQAVEDYTGEEGCWDVHVTDGASSIRRTTGTSGDADEVEERFLRELAATVPGVVSVRVLGSGATS